MTHKSMRKVMAAILSAAMLFQMGTAPATQAAVKVKLAKKSIVLTEKKSKTVKVTGVKKAKIKKVKWSTSRKKIATVKAKGKTAVKVTAKKAGNAKVTGKFTLKGVKKVQKVTLKVRVKKASKAIRRRQPRRKIRMALNRFCSKMQLSKTEQTILFPVVLPKCLRQIMDTKVNVCMYPAVRTHGTVQQST